MFLGRVQELNKLEYMYRSNTFEMAVIYGRRRVGKTTLINKFCMDKKTIFFAALESNSAENLSAFSTAIFTCTMPNSAVAPSFKNFSEALDYIAEIAKDERIVLVIDEYPYLASSNKSISSLLQNTIDHKYKNSKLFIILCGSSMSFMEYQVLGYKSPLYGRRTAQFKILSFDYYDTAKWVSGYTAEEKSIVYGVTGGVPLYLEKFIESVPLNTNIRENVFDKNALLFEEPSNLLKQELREPQTYNSIIAAIATGSTRISEIASKVGLESGLCTKYISNLISLGIIKRETPITEKGGKKTIYLITDNLFRFWYRFVPSNMASIASGRIKTSYETAVEPFISDYMGLIFEQMCKDYLLFHCDNLPIEVGEIGQWWGNNPKKKSQAQIDIVLTDPTGKSALFGECKFKNELMDIDVLTQLVENAALLTEIKEKHYCIFSKSGFTDRLMKKAKTDGVMLISLEEMYQ
jgi:AAA+ ATPase superfamily predicted ATPase